MMVWVIKKGNKYVGPCSYTSVLSKAVLFRTSNSASEHRIYKKERVVEVEIKEI
jgi:hypothetical protein